MYAFTCVCVHMYFCVFEYMCVGGGGVMRMHGRPPKIAKCKTWTEGTEIQKHLDRKYYIIIFKISNTTISSKMQAKQSIIDRIQRRQHKWYGQLLRMDDSRWPKTSYIRRRIGISQHSCKNQVTDFMRSRNMEEFMAEDRQLWHLGMGGCLLAV